MPICETGGKKRRTTHVEGQVFVIITLIIKLLLVVFGFNWVFCAGLAAYFRIPKEDCEYMLRTFPALALFIIVNHPLA